MRGRHRLTLWGIGQVRPPEARTERVPDTDLTDRERAEVALNGGHYERPVSGTRASERERR